MMDRESKFTSAVLRRAYAVSAVAKTDDSQRDHDCADAAQQAILQAWEQLDSLAARGISKRGWSVYSSTSAHDIAPSAAACAV